MKPIVSVNTNQAWAREVKDYLMIALGMILYGIGWTVFLLPNNLPSGAVPGIASIVYWGTGLPVQYASLVENLGMEIQCEDSLCSFCPDFFPLRHTRVDIWHPAIGRPTLYGVHHRRCFLW